MKDDGRGVTEGQFAAHSARLELSQCLRRCSDLEAQLRHAINEQSRIRQILQARLLQNQIEYERLLNVGRNEAETLQKECAIQLQQSRQEAESRISCLYDQKLEIRQRLEASLSEAKTALMNLENDWVSRHEATIIGMNRKLAECELAKQGLGDQLKALQEHVRSIETELRGVYQSLSWRISAPLRWLNWPFSR